MTTKRLLKYTHQPLDEDITAISGHYTPHKEVRWQCGDREVLYIIGQACMDSACCGSGNWDYGLVPGYIVNWQTRTNDAGLAVTEVEPIANKQVKNEIEHYIKETEGVSRVEFW